MILLVIGVVVLLAAVRIAATGREGMSEDVRSAGAAAWAALVGLLVLGQLVLGRDRLDGYQLRLLGFRYSVTDAEGAPKAEPLHVGGDYLESDVWVPGAGEVPAARLVPFGSDRLDGVGVVREEDAGAVVMVERPGLFGASWRVVGGVPLEVGDTVLVQVPGRNLRLTVGEVPEPFSLLGLEMSLPWVEVPEIVDVESGVSVMLPGVRRSSLRRLRSLRPSAFQRTYPLADVLEAWDPASPGAGALTSFFYYDEGRLHLADLDSEVEVQAAAPTFAEAVAWSTEAGGRRILVAGLPFRDYPEPDLSLPERYGLRPLRSFRIDAAEGWLDLALTRPEIRSLDRTALEEVGASEVRDPDGRGLYRVRFAPGRNALARRAVVFDGVPDRFAVTSQAILRLPREPTEGSFEVLTPGGLGEWSTGRPMTLGGGDRALLVRVDGLGTSRGFWVVYGAAVLALVLLFLRRPMSAGAFSLALVAMGLGAFRLILGASALARFPYVTESQQIGLWLFLFLPWAVIAVAEAFRTDREPEPPRLSSWRAWLFHAFYTLGLIGAASVLFPGSAAKLVVLSGLALAVLGIWFLGRAGWPHPSRPWEALSRWTAARPWWSRGWTLGAALLLFRVVLELLGWREQVTLAGTRIGVSVFYTPLVVAALGLVLVRVATSLRSARDAVALSRAAAWGVLEAGAFVLLAYAGVSAWINDFGVALVLLPGALALTALVGFWVPVSAGLRRPARLAAVTMAVPLLLFVLLQAAPPLLSFAWATDLQQADARLGEWNRNELLLLERGDPSALELIGQRRSEALAVMRQTMRSYTRGNVMGKGFLQGRISDEIAETATREHAVSALLASQFGLPGTLGLMALLIAMVAPPLELFRPRPSGREAGRAVALTALLVLAMAPVAYVLPSPFNALLVLLLALFGAVVLLGPVVGVDRVWVVGAEGGARSAGHDEEKGDAVSSSGPSLAAFLLVGATATMGLAGLYMVLANYGFVFFTGKNVYLLGLDSVGDLLESAALFSMAAAAMTVCCRRALPSREDGVQTEGEQDGDEWWLVGVDEGRGGGR